MGTAQSKSGNFFLVARYRPSGITNGSFKDNVEIAQDGKSRNSFTIIFLFCNGLPVDNFSDLQASSVMKRFSIWPLEYIRVHVENTTSENRSETTSKDISKLPNINVNLHKE